MYCQFYIGSNLHCSRIVFFGYCYCFSIHIFSGALLHTDFVIFFLLLHINLLHRAGKEALPSFVELDPYIDKRDNWVQIHHVSEPWVHLGFRVGKKLMQCEAKGKQLKKYLASSLHIFQLWTYKEQIEMLDTWLTVKSS